MSRQQVHERQDVRAETSADELPLALDRDDSRLHLLDDRVSEGEIDHEALLPAELTGAGLVGIVQDLEVFRTRVETAEPDGAGTEKTFRLLDTRVRSNIHRYDHLVVDPAKKFRNCFPVW